MGTKGERRTSAERTMPSPRSRQARQLGGAVSMCEKIRTIYHVSGRRLARLIGVPEATLANWEKGNGKADAASVKRLKKVEALLNRLARVMRRGYIARWLARPNRACGGDTPLQVLERQDYQTIEDMIFFFESGVPS